MYINTGHREKSGKIEEVRSRNRPDNDDDSRNYSRLYIAGGKMVITIVLAVANKTVRLNCTNVKTWPVSCLSNWLFQHSISGEWEALRRKSKKNNKTGLTTNKRKFRGGEGVGRIHGKAQGQRTQKKNKINHESQSFLIARHPAVGFYGLVLLRCFWIMDTC